MVAAVEFGHAVGIGDGKTRAESLPYSQQGAERKAKIQTER